MSSHETNDSSLSPASGPPPGSARAAVSRGWDRVRDAWPQVLAAYGLSLLLSLSLAAALQVGLRESLEHREAAERLLQGWDGLWHASFSTRAEGLEATFDAGVVGIGAVLRSLDALVQGALLDLPLPLVVAGLLYLLGWVWLGGGLLARFGGDRRGVITLGAVHFRRLLSVAAVGWIGWALVLGSALPMLSRLVEHWCRDVVDERVHAAWLLGKYALVWSLVLAIRWVVDYAKVIAVADPSCSAGSALREGLRLCLRRARAVVGIAAILGAIGLALLVLYSFLAPGADQGNPFKILVAFLISQTSVVARVVMRAWGLASEQALWEAGRGR
ncbi:hypothetical protein [Paraliomyxa miuraensis]|uniref:hypothetical protein n=1 Tax=Paraliomyxa miuraensis TaxID=376150 RepID=UPI00225214ED|nr:hypothetical protein [Paraliomyxa miuraensis]MCX4242199.1 hypothetical protein [Paraliomyxa miuraensis]